MIASHIAFKIGTEKKEMSSLELSSEFELCQKTYWAFKQKVQGAESSLKGPLTGAVRVDELVIGGPEEGKKGRSKGLEKIDGSCY